MTDRPIENLWALVMVGVVVLSVLTVVGPGFAGLVGAANQSTGDSLTWPQNQYDNARTGQTNATSGPTGPVESSWSVELTDTSNPTVSPVVANGTIFVGSDDGNVSAYYANNGSHLWTTKVITSKSDPIQSLTVDGGTLYVSGRWNVYALDPATGATVWGSPYSLEADDARNNGAEIIVSGDRLYVSAGNSATFDDGYLYAINTTTGTQDWRFQTDTYLWGGGVSLSNDTAYLGDAGGSSFSGHGGIYAVNTTSGTEQWSKNYSDSRVMAAPTVANGTVFVNKENGDLVAYEAETGNERWNTTVSFGVDVVESAAVANGVVYVGTKNTGEVWAYDADTGAEVWSGPFESEGTGGTVASPVVVDGVLYVAITGDLYGVYPNNGTERFVHAYGSGESTPAVVDGTVYVHDGSSPGNLYAITDVTEPANFDVSVASTNSSVEEGQTLTITVDVENVGEEQGQQNVTLTIDSVERDRQSVTLDPGENQTVTLEWATTAGDAGDYTASVQSENTTDTVSVTVQSPSTAPNLTASIDVTTAPATEGETLTVDATIENTGGASGTQTVVLSIDGTDRDSTAVTLAPDENTTVSLSWSSSDGDAGDYTATVATENDTDSTSVSVLKPPTFEVTVDSTNSPVEEGDSLMIDVTVENTGDLNGTQTVALEVNGTERDTTTLGLNSGQSVNSTLSWATAEGAAGDYTATVASANDSDTASVTVESASTGGSSSSGGSSSTGGAGDTAPSTSTATPEPTPTVTATAASTATATSDSTASPTTAATSSPSATPSSTDTASSTDEVTASPPEATDSPETSPDEAVTETPGQPGFGFLVALLTVGLLGLGLSRRRN